MKTSNVRPDHQQAAIAGRVLPSRAASGAVVVSDGTTDVLGAAEIDFLGAAVNDAGDGVAQVIVNGTGQSAVNDSGSDLNEGDVVVLDTDGEVITTTTAQDTRPVGVVQAGGPDGELVHVVFQGYVPQVNTNGSINAGDYLETDSTAGLAVGNPTPRAGSFGIALATGTNPPAQLFGQTYLSGGGSGGGGGVPSWFNVRDYGAVGDGSTDDTAAFNLAIAALVAAGTGVLYIPASPTAYIVSSGLSTISVPCLIMGDGWTTALSGRISQINFTSTTGTLWTITANGCGVRDLAMFQTGGTASAGAAINCTGGTLTTFERLLVSGFYTSFDVEGSSSWQMRRCFISTSRKYGVRVRNTALPDAGDWIIEGNTFSNGVPADAAIRIESSGGGRILANKVIGLTGGNTFDYAVDLSAGTGVSTAILIIEGNSFEFFVQDGIRIANSGSGQWSQFVIIGNAISMYSNNSGRAVRLSGSGISYALIAHNFFITDGTARAAVSVTSSTNVRVGPNLLSGFNAEYTGTPNIDDTGAIGSGVQITGAASSGAVATGTGASTATWQSLSSAGIAPNTVDYLVGTASAGLTGEIVVGTSPGGELGGTWASPTVDATHAGGTHLTLSSATPLVESGSGSAGSGTAASKDDHVHPAGASASTAPVIGQEERISDGTTTAWGLDNDFEEFSVSARNLTTGHNLSVTETLPNTATISAAGTAGDVIAFSYTPQIA